MVLLFFVGLQTRVADILRVGGRAGLVAVLGVLGLGRRSMAIVGVGMSR